MSSQTQPKSKQELDVAKRLWEDYFNRLSAYGDRLRDEIFELQRCFSISGEDMEEAKKIVSEEMNAKGRLF